MLANLVARVQNLVSLVASGFFKEIGVKLLNGGVLMGFADFVILILIVEDCRAK